MEETIEKLRSYAWMVVRNRNIALVGFLLISLIGGAFVMMMPNRYETTTKVFIDTRTILKPLLKGLAVEETGADYSAVLMRRTLLSRPNLQKVIRNSDLDTHAETPKKLEAMINRLSKDVVLAGSAENNVYTISYTANEPQLAKNVVAELLNIFVETTLRSNRTDTTIATQFLDEQISLYNGRLQQSEASLEEFKRDNVGIMPRDGATYFQQMQQLKTKIEDTELELKESENRRQELKRQLAGWNENISTEQADAPLPTIDTPLAVRIQNLRLQLDNYLLNYTEQHPDVKATKRMLAQLEAQQNNTLEDRENSDDSDISYNISTIRNPVFQELQVSLGQLEANMASLQVRVSEYKSRAEKLEQLIDTIPKVEAQLLKLTRDYDVTSKTYSDLVSRRESASISIGAGESSDNIRFRIIDPPIVPLIPTGPNRLLYLLATLIVAIGGGLSLAIIAAMLKPSIYTRQELKEVSGLEVLGSVSMVWSEKEISTRRKQLAMIFGSIFLVAAIYIVTLILFKEGIKLPNIQL